MSNTPKRNDLCSCGSGKKYKKCCLKDDEMKRDRLAGLARKKLPKQRLQSFLGLTSFLINPVFTLTLMRKMPYKGANIYVYQYGAMFQYLFAYKNEIYQDNFFLKPRLWRRFLHFFKKPLYNKDQYDYGEQVVLSGAMKSLDELTATPSEIANPIPLNS